MPHRARNVLFTNELLDYRSSRGELTVDKATLERIAQNWLLLSAATGDDLSTRFQQLARTDNPMLADVGKEMLRELESAGTPEGLFLRGSKRALEKLCKLAGAGTPPDVLAPLWTDQLRAPALKLFADQVEKNRELAITLASDLLAELPEVTVLGTLPWLIPAIHARVGTNPITEVAEELRLQLLKLVAALVPRCGAALAPHLPEIVQILVMAFADPFPDAKKEGCSIAVALGGAVASHLGPHCKGLIFGLSPALAHQHSRVRSGATEALFSLILHEPSVLSDASPQISLITVDRAPAVREQAVAVVHLMVVVLAQGAQAVAAQVE